MVHSLSGVRMSASLTAVLGPTNTGKTHLAVERMCAHSGGMIGFPLRLLAREVYDRVVKVKGKPQVALLTGEERILPPGARYFLCTAESMPTDRAFPFVAIDEAQMGADPDRGHVFTNAMLHVRGTDETMILGAETLRPLIRRLLPDAKIIARPRFSSLDMVEPIKLSRLPARSAIVAFTGEEVYAIAEMLRRHKGGAAVVMGSLSPRTRNAQVELYQSGEVDYLVATDAIGMGLNLDISHIAFASLSKFDGRRHRRLHVSEMAQIAGRAGRYQRNGTFSTTMLGIEKDGDGPLFAPDEIEAIENHEFPPLKSLMWRNFRLDYSSLPRLITSLEVNPAALELWRGADAIDLQVLKKLAEKSWVQERAQGKNPLIRLWSTCGLPDYRRTGVDAHAELVGRIYRHLTEGDGFLPENWIQAELAALDNVAGDIATLSDRIAAARTWTYASHRSSWLRNPEEWAATARTIEDRLSDALHQRLTQKFVDRRTSLLLRGIKNHERHIHAEVEPDGSVVVEGVVIGLLSGFRFQADPSARAGEKRLLLAAGEKNLRKELVQRANAMAQAPDTEFALDFDGRDLPSILWKGEWVARLRPGKDMLHPEVELERTLDQLEARDKALRRLNTWLETQKAQHLSALDRLNNLQDKLSPAARGMIVQLVETLGVLPRENVENLIASLTLQDRRVLARSSVRLGVMHIFSKQALKPEATRWRLALWAAANQITDMPLLPAPGRTSLLLEPEAPADFYSVAGFWPLSGFAVRVDIADRIACTLHDQRPKKRNEPAGFKPDPALQGSAGLSNKHFAQLLRALGFRNTGKEEGIYAFHHRHRRTVRKDKNRPLQANINSPFAKLGEMLGG